MSQLAETIQDAPFHRVAQGFQMPIDGQWLAVGLGHEVAPNKCGTAAAPLLAEDQHAAAVQGLVEAPECSHKQKWMEHGLPATHVPQKVVHAKVCYIREVWVPRGGVTPHGTHPLADAACEQSLCDQRCTHAPQP